MKNLPLSCLGQQSGKLETEHLCFRKMFSLNSLNAMTKYLQKGLFEPAISYLRDKDITP